MINANGVLTTYGGGNGSIISAAELEYMGPGPEASILGTQVEYFAVSFESPFSDFLSIAV